MPNRELVMFQNLLRWFGRSKLWKWFAQNVVAHFTFRVMSYPSFPMEDFFDLVDLLGKGGKQTIYCFASSDHASLASVMIRKVTGSGVFSHAGILLPGTARGTHTLHMLGEGPECYHLLELLRQLDYFAVVAVDLNLGDYREARKRIQHILNNKEKFQYDYAQELHNGGNKLYCSEMVYAVLQGLVEDPDFKARRLLGRKVFDPDQVLKIGRLVYTNHPDLAKISENQA